MKQIKNRITMLDYIKAHRIASRKEEIEQHGKQMVTNAIHRSGKAYNRKSFKKGTNAIIEAEGC